MGCDLTRRSFLSKAAAGIGVASVASVLPQANRAWAARTTLVGVQWGGPWIDGAKAVAAKQDKYDIKWELHTGGAAAIVAKIKAAWPKPLYDFVAQFTPLYYAWIREGWPEPLTYEEMPNLRDIPDDVLTRNEKGEIISVPFSHSSVFFGYRKDITPFPIKTMEDLLDPRLKGKIIVRDATQGLNNNTVMFALAFGGNERNMEPGWAFLKKLAQSGNIGRVGKTEVDFINALTSGEAAVGFWNIGAWGKVAESFPVEFLIKSKSEVPGFQAGTFTEGYMIPKNSTKKKEAKDFLNFFISSDSCTLYNKHVNMVPTNVKSQSTGLAQMVTFKTKEERDKYSHAFDYEYLSPLGSEMIKRFEREIVPLLR
jgi:putative spermidine/putrescine transport system substrate-binding protein